MKTGGGLAPAVVHRPLTPPPTTYHLRGGIGEGGGDKHRYTLSIDLLSNIRFCVLAFDITAIALWMHEHRTVHLWRFACVILAMVVLWISMFFNTFALLWPRIKDRLPGGKGGGFVFPTIALRIGRSNLTLCGQDSDSDDDDDESDLEEEQGLSPSPPVFARSRNGNKRPAVFALLDGTLGVLLIIFASTITSPYWNWHQRDEWRKAKIFSIIAGSFQLGLGLLALFRFFRTFQLEFEISFRRLDRRRPAGAIGLPLDTEATSQQCAHPKH